MKKIITILLMSLPLFVMAQTAPPIFMGSKYYEYRNSIRVDSAFFAPRRDTIIRDLTLKAEGMLTYRPQDKSLWYFNGAYWLRLSSGADIHVAIDSARRSNDTLFFRYTTGDQIAVKIAQLPVTAVNGLPDSLAARPDTNLVKLIQNIDTVLTISAMQSYSGRAKLIVVKDTLRGGLFMKKGIAIVDNGITFSGVTDFWTRVGINNAPANILWYGAVPNDGTNDNAAITAAIATNRAVYVPDGTYLVTSSQTLNDNQTIYGNGNTSILQTTTANNIQIINMGNYCTVRDLKFLGSGKGSTTPYVSVNGTQIAVRMLSKSRGLVANCTFQNMGGAGFYCQTTANVSHEGSTVTNCQADSCFNGFYSGTGGEYINYISCRAFKCDYGATFLGGNNKFNSGTLDNNQTGIRIISDRGNDAHGEVVGSTINHSYQYSVSIDSTLNSFLFAHNLMYYGKINIKKVVNGVVFEGNDIASTDTIFVNSSTNVQFNNNRFISTLPQLMKNWNGTGNINPVTSDISMFNNRYINVVPYSQITHPQNQLLGGVNIYGNTTNWGNNTGILNLSYSVFQESDGTRVGYIGDAASFDSTFYIVALNNRNIRFGGLVGDGSMVPVTMNAVFSPDNHYAFGDSLIDRSGYVPMFRITGGAMRSDSLIVASNTPTARTHIVGTMRFQSGLPGVNKVWTDTTGNGTGAWRISSGSGPVKDFYTDATSADTLYPYTIPPSYLTNNGDKIFFNYAGTFAATGITDHTVGVAIAGNLVASMSNGITSGGKWRIQGSVIRVSNTVVRYVADISFDNTGVTTNLTLNTDGELTGLNLSSNGLRIGLAVGSPNANVTATLGTITYISAAP